MIAFSRRLFRIVWPVLECRIPPPKRPLASGLRAPGGARCSRRNIRGATSRQCGGKREMLLPPGWGGGRTCLGPVDPTRLPPSRASGSARSARQAGMGVECRHSGGLVSTPSPTLPLPGGGSQNIGRADYGRLPPFHNAKRFVSHEPPLQAFKRNGSRRSRWPVSAASALATAGAIGGVAGSPPH